MEELIQDLIELEQECSNRLIDLEEVSERLTEIIEELKLMKGAK